MSKRSRPTDRGRFVVLETGNVAEGLWTAGAAVSSTRVFVYGSLCSGEPAHARLEGTEFLGEWWTQPHYTLLHLGAYPGLVASGETRVRGELYRVSAAQLRALDFYEGHPDEFVRVAIDLAPEIAAEGYLWNGNPGEGAVVASGDWRRRVRR